jgi:uncharacterized protein YcfJ
LEVRVNTCTKTFLAAAALLLSTAATAQITFYEGEGFRGRAFTTEEAVADFRSSGFNDRASSAVVDKGRWEACEAVAFGGRCLVLREGAYGSLAGMGMNDRVSSVRRVSGSGHYTDAPDPMPQADYEYRRRPNERVYEAEVTSVHEVVAESGQHCWIERGQVEQSRGPRNVAGGVIGAVVGGVIGHQFGAGRGNDAATAGGAIAGAAVGSNQGRDSEVRSADVQRCETASNAAPEYWDVGYQFHDVDHRIQMTSPPGRTIIVNENGEPRQ